MKKMFLLFVFVLCLGQVSFAGQLKQDDKGIYCVKDNGTYAISEWITIDLDSDGKEEYYYFDSKGYLMSNSKTPDGYDVNAKGQWIKDGKVQTKSKNSNSSSYVNSGSISSIYDAYNQGINAGLDAVNAGVEAGMEAAKSGVDLGASILNDTADVIGNMYGGILKDEINDYKSSVNQAASEIKSEYNKAMDDYKKEYNKAMDSYKSEINSAMNQYKSALSELGRFGW